MESLLKQFNQGVLNDLENLDVAAKDRKRKQQQLSSDKKCLRQLEKKLASLERRKQELQQTLKLAKQNLTSGEDEDVTTTTVCEAVTDDVVKLMKLREIADFYRLSGTSIDSVSENDKVVLRFDTSYEGQFVKSYFVEINKTWNQAVLHHTLPSSIPVSELAKRSDLPKFVSEVRKYLYAVTSRQKEVTILQKDCSAILSGDVECSSSADYVRMTVTPFEDTFPLRVTLTYEELMDVLPSSVTLKALVSDDENLAELSDTLLQTWTELFKTTPLTKALVKIVSMEVQTETSDCSSEL